MGDFEVTRSESIAAPPERLHGLIDDFHRWREWSPWEELDPNMKRDYSGAESGVGARYAWEGNRKAGKGNMEITDVQPQRVEVRLTFEKPWKATNQVVFDLTPKDGAGTPGGGVQAGWAWTASRAVVARPPAAARRDVERRMLTSGSVGGSGGPRPLVVWELAPLVLGP